MVFCLGLPLFCLSYCSPNFVSWSIQVLKEEIRRLERITMRESQFALSDPTEANTSEQTNPTAESADKDARYRTEYLKNVILKLICSTPDAVERPHLVSVLSSLLMLSAPEQQSLQDGILSTHKNAHPSTKPSSWASYLTGWASSSGWSLWSCVCHSTPLHFPGSVTLLYNNACSPSLLPYIHHVHFTHTHTHTGIHLTSCHISDLFRSLFSAVDPVKHIHVSCHTIRTAVKISPKSYCLYTRPYV